MSMSLWRCLLVAGLVGVTWAGRPGPTTDTPLGKVRGHWSKSRSGRNYIAFSGLPYAKPPVGQLRFEPPQPAEPWTGVKNAVEDGPLCAQYTMFDDNPEPTGVEDCLYLSVYTHNLTGRRPVLVYFHGGGYISGNGARKSGPQYFMDEDLVIVMVNYRLAYFGFLSFEDKDMPGNQGMKDQVMALKWVQDNIASFGGDPKRVTLVGESAGAGSVYLHTVSPLSRGLFHSGIAESGTGYAPWALGAPGAARNTSMWLLSLTGCQSKSTKEAVACLRNVDAKKLASFISTMNEGWETEIHAFVGSTLEPPHPGAFLVGPIRNWRHEPVPLITGVTSGEGLVQTLYFDFANISYEQYNRNFLEVGPRSLQIEGYSSEPREVVQALYNYYFPRGNVSEKDWVNLTSMYTDSWFAIGMIDGANRHSHTGNVYVYNFDYLGNYSLVGSAQERNSSLVIGAFHTDEIIYLWYKKEYENLQGADLQLSKKLVKLWANFATHGNPTPDRSICKWDRWNIDQFNYLNIDKDGFKMKKGFIRNKYNFWQTLKYRDNMK